MMTISYNEYRILDKIALREWEELVGFPIEGDKVRVSYHFFEEHYERIYQIQIASAVRLDLERQRVK